MRRVLICIFLVLAVALGLCSALTEADFKKMKVKQLKEFLAERGLSCDGCEEKEEFVRLAVKNKDAPAKAAAGKKPLPSGELWEVWSGVAKDICTEVAAQKSAAGAAAVCDNIAVAVDAVFMQYGKRTATKLKKKPAALLKTSWGDVYQNAGRKLLQKVARYCLHAKNAGKCKSSGAVQELLEVDGKIKGVELLKYLTNVGIENTNTMYEALKDKALDKDEL